MQNAPYLKKSATGVWYVHWTERRIGKRVSTRETDLARAKQFLASWLLMEGAAPRGAEITLADVWAVYREKHVANKVSGQYNADLAWAQVSPFFGGMLVSALTQDSVDEYVAKRTSGRLGRRVKPQTAAKELSYLLAAVRFCADPRRRIVDPALAPKFDLPEPGAPRERWLRRDEIDRLFAAAERLRVGERLSRAERFLWLALETAGRKEALLDLTWDRVDFDARVVMLDVPGRRRTKKRRATVPISGRLMPILRRAFEERTGDVVLDHKGAVWAAIQRVAIAAGFSDQVVAPGHKPRATGISPHVFRHTAATHMARNGVSLWKIALILGNTVAVTERSYAKYQPEDLRVAVDQIRGEAA